MRRILGMALGLLAALAPLASAQTNSGNIYGTVTDESGAVLPGVSVAIKSNTIGARSTTSGTKGDFRFLKLAPDTYKLTVTLSGSARVSRGVIVNSGQKRNLT